MAADLRAASAQSQRAEAPVVAQHLDEAIARWQTALAVCEDRPRQRAERNLRDNQRQRQQLGDQLGSGAACASSSKNAQALQDLGHQAVNQRRWSDASGLFGKAEGAWELASEQCSGEAQRRALQAREQMVLDGHNAEFCGPLFDRARGVHPAPPQRCRRPGSG